MFLEGWGRKIATNLRDQHGLHSEIRPALPTKYLKQKIIPKQPNKSQNLLRYHSKTLSQQNKMKLNTEKSCTQETILFVHFLCFTIHPCACIK